MQRHAVFSSYPFGSQRRAFSTFDQNFDFKIRREHPKKIPMSATPMSRYIDVMSLFGLYLLGIRKPVLQDSKGYSADSN